MVRTATSLAALLLLGACASTAPDLKPLEDTRPLPAPAYHPLPAVTFPVTPRKEKEFSCSGIRGPRKGEVQGGIWTVPYSRDCTYLVTIGTANENSTDLAQQVLITFDGRSVFEAVTAHEGYWVKGMGPGIVVGNQSPMPGPKARAHVNAGNNIVNLVLQSVAGMGGISEVRFVFENEGEEASASLPTKPVCTDYGYSVDRYTSWGPTSACVYMDAKRAGNAVYFTLPANTTDAPLVGIGDGNETVRPVNPEVTMQPDGSRLYKVPGAHAQIVLTKQNGEHIVLTRSRIR